MLNFIDNQREIKIFEPQNYLLEKFWNLLDISWKSPGNLLEFHSQDLMATLVSDEVCVPKFPIKYEELNPKCAKNRIKTFDSIAIAILVNWLTTIMIVSIKKPTEHFDWTSITWCDRSNHKYYGAINIATIPVLSCGEYTKRCTCEA